MMQKERRATIAQEQVRAMKESMPAPPTTVQSWRKQFINAVVGGHAGKGKQLVVAIMLLSDDELIHVSGKGSTFSAETCVQTYFLLEDV
jgi:hypothetical protein